MYWTDNSVSLERVMEMKRFQVNTPMQRLPSQKSSGGRVRRGLLVEQRVAEGNSSVPASTCAPSLHQLQRVQVHKPLLLLCL